MPNHLPMTDGQYITIKLLFSTRSKRSLTYDQFMAGSQLTYEGIIHISWHGLIIHVRPDGTTYNPYESLKTKYERKIAKFLAHLRRLDEA